MNLSEKLKALRKAEGLTQKKLSELIECSYSAYQKYELGIIEPTHGSMVKICQQFPQYTLWLMTHSVDIDSIKNQVIEVDDRTVL